jgi:hypothetical protein
MPAQEADCARSLARRAATRPADESAINAIKLKLMTRRLLMAWAEAKRPPLSDPAREGVDCNRS